MMKTAKSAFLLIGAMFLSFGLIFMGVSLGIFRSNERLMETGVSVPGVYSEVGGKNVYFSYEAEGRVWERRSSVSSFTMREGDEVTVWYPVGQPGQGRITVWESWGVFLIVGGIFSVMGAGFLLSMLPQVLLRRSLVINGIPVTARVTDVRQISWVRFNSRHPYVVHAVCVHPYTGQEMKVRSGMLMENPQPHIRNNEVVVLVDPMRENRYYMKIGE